jgi:predicted DCC family thiol-disulfide oxidoreductase YuxK
MTDSRRNAVLLFDGDCAFCAKSASIGPRLRLKCDFTPRQPVDLESLGIDPTRAEREVAFRGADATVLYGHEAIAAALKTGALPWRTLSRAITFGPIDHLSARIYRLVSRHRHQLSSRTPKCKNL